MYEEHVSKERYQGALVTYSLLDVQAGLQVISANTHRL